MAAEALAAFDSCLRSLIAVNGRRKELKASIERNEASLALSQQAAEDWTRAADVIRSFSDESSERLRADIERLVTHGLRTVFEDDSLTFVVTTRVLRGATSVEFSLRSGDVERPILNSYGGGVAEVVAFVLRVVVTLLSGKRPLLVLDEPFSRVSANFRPRLARFVRELVDQTNLQIIAVTHDDHLPEVADVHYSFAQVEGATVAHAETPSGPAPSLPAS